MKLYQKDFKYGSLRILKPGIYELAENIKFRPNPKLSFYPRSNDELYSDPAYILGFFTAISVECDNVCIDLGGYELSYAEDYCLQQRYGSLIELSNTPFPPGMGPANFGPKLISANSVIIRNGKLGLTSHHGIHGNNCDKIKIEKCTVYNFEVAGISLNGCTNVDVTNVKIGPNRQNIPVLGTYSHARFLLYLSKAFCKHNETKLSEEDKQKIEVCSYALEKCISKVKWEIEKYGKTSNKLFANPTGLLDSNCYGICIYPKGIAVHDLVDDSYAQDMSSNIKICNVEICNIKCKTAEIPSISEKNGDFVQFDIAGGVFQILKCLDSNGYYKPNELSELQLALAQPSLKFGNMTITKDVVEWAQSGKHVSKIFTQSNSQYRYRCGGDVMFHLAKGAIGLRVDGTCGLQIKNVTISGVKNYARLGNAKLNGKYTFSHTYQSRPMYHGSDAIGLSLSHVSSSKITNLSISDIRSLNGMSCGLYTYSKCKKITFCNINVRNVRSGCYKNGKVWYGIGFNGKKVKYRDFKPNGMPTAYGIYFSSGLTRCKKRRIRISKILGPKHHKLYYY